MLCWHLGGAHRARVHCPGLGRCGSQRPSWVLELCVAALQDASFRMEVVLIWRVRSGRQAGWGVFFLQTVNMGFAKLQDLRQTTARSTQGFPYCCLQSLYWRRKVHLFKTWLPLVHCLILVGLQALQNGGGGWGRLCGRTSCPHLSSCKLTWGWSDIPLHRPQLQTCAGHAPIQSFQRPLQMICISSIIQMKVFKGVGPSH